MRRESRKNARPGPGDPPGHNPELFTPTERTSLWHLTDVNFKHDGPGDMLRNSELEAVRDPALAGFMLTVNAALAKLPDHEGTVRRGIGVKQGDMDDFLKRYQVGATVIHNDLTHSTTDPDVLDRFEGRVDFVIQSRHGKGVSRWSQYRDESEVMFKAGAAFKVTRVRENNGFHYIHMREIAED